MLNKSNYWLLVLAIAACDSEERASEEKGVIETGYLLCTTALEQCGGGSGCTDDTGAFACVAVPAECGGDATCGCWGELVCGSVACESAPSEQGFTCDGLSVADAGLPAFECSTAADCDDGNPCTQDACDGVCYNHPDVTGPCDDGNACTVDDACNLGVCSGAPLGCDDGDICTLDSCDPAKGCQHTADPGACAAQCGSNADCDDGNPCTEDACDGVCYNHADFVGPCDDGNACTVDDACNLGVCSGAPLGCDDGDNCTLDVCDPAKGCQHVAGRGACEVQCTSGADCDDGNPCTEDACDGICYNHPDVTAPCDDGNACTVDDVCNLGSCSGAPLGCDDADPCTIDFCNPGTGCQHEFSAIACGFECTTNADCDDGNPCTEDACDGICYNHADFAGPCDDGNACTVDDVCNLGACSGAPLGCDDADPCTIDFCNPGTGCQHEFSAIACGFECSTKADCDDGNPCTEDACDGICYNHPDVTGPCDDGDACTVSDVCSGGDCTGQFLTCDDGVACTFDFCSPLAGCIYDDSSCN
jgi:hypothetical protein